ncbi:hypothetical protein LCGC14_1537170, partial [marine sediment metagenome]
MKMALKTKLLVLFLLVGVIPLAAVSVLMLWKSSGALEDGAYNQLVSVRDIKKAQVETFFSERQGDMGVLVETVNTLRDEAFKKLAAIRQIKKNQIEGYFQDRLALMTDVQKNLRFTGGLPAFAEAFPQGLESEAYKKVYSQRIGGLKMFQDIFGFYDVFLIDTEGNVVFTVAKEADWGTNLASGPLKDSGLAKAFHKGKAGSTTYIDFEWYEPSKEPSAFLTTPLHGADGQVIGVAAFQVSLKQINVIMAERSGMGKTGETYLVGPDLLMRSDSFLDPQNHSVKASFKNPDKGKVDTEAAREALAGKVGADVILDYNNNPVLSAYSPVKVGGLTWAIIAEIDVAEAFCPKIEGKDKDFFTQYKEQYGYYDLFLINPDGYCFYTVCEEADYKTNLVNGKYASSGLGKLVRKVLQTNQFGLADFEPYAPSNGEPAAFIAQPVVHNGETEIIVALQLSLDAINKIMTQRDGMGETGETYLVGSDKRMRSDSFLDKAGHSVKASFAGTIKDNGVDTEAATKALAGETDSKIIIDYNGNPVLSAYTPVKVGSTTWALLAEMDESEALAAVTAMQWIVGIIAASGIAAIILVALLVANSIAKPINRIIANLTAGAEQTTSAAGQVSSASQSLAQGASEQAAAIEETTSSVEEMASMTKQNAGNAGEAKTLAAGASSSAAKGA